MDAGREGMKWQEAVMEFSLEALEAGFPSLWGGLSGVPSDVVIFEGDSGDNTGYVPPIGYDYRSHGTDGAHSC